MVTPGLYKGALDRVSVLVVDDEPDIVRLVMRQLVSAGARAVGAHDADEALAHLDEAPVDCMVCDISMPGISGVDLLRRIRSHESGAHRSLPAIAFTGEVDGNATDALEREGFQACLLKPADLAAVVTTVRKVLH